MLALIFIFSKLKCTYSFFHYFFYLKLVFLLALIIFKAKIECRGWIKLKGNIHQL